MASSTIFFSLWHDLTWDGTPVSQTIGECSKLNKHDSWLSCFPPCYKWKHIQTKLYAFLLLLILGCNKKNFSVLTNLSFKAYLWFGLVWLGLVYLFNSISTPYELFNAKIWFFSKCMATIITIFSMFHCNFKIVLTLSICNHLFAHSYGFKYSYSILIIVKQI